MNLLEPFLASAERHAQRIAIVAGDGGRTSFGELIALSAGLAAAWRRAGIGRGDRVVIAMPLGPKLYAGLAALWRLGAVAVLPEPALGLKGLRHAAGATAPKAYLADGWFRLLRYLVPELWQVGQMLTPGDATAAGEPLEAVAPEHAALISFTSGSTGRPKAIARSHGFLQAQDAALAGLIAPRREDETDLVAFPVFVVANLGLGITSVLPNWNLRRHDEARAETIAAHAGSHGVTRALVPPSICETLAGSSAPLRLDALFTGGGPVFPDLLERLASRLPATDIVSVYGWREQFGRMLIEAFACGVPVVGSDSGEIPFVIGDAGRVVREADVAGWARTIAELLADPDERRDMTRRGLERVRQFSVAAIAEQYRNFYLWLWEQQC